MGIPLPKGKATQLCKNAMMLLGYSHPHLLLIHSYISNNYNEVPSGTLVGGQPIDTLAVASNGNIYINPEYVASLSQAELGGVMAHEMLHLILKHLDRVNARDRWVWNIATDACINHHLKEDNIRLPDGCIYPPNEYKGDLYAEAMYEWLMKNPQHVPKQPKIVMPGAGCSAIEDGKGKDGGQPKDGEGPTDWKKVYQEARAASKMYGKGSNGIKRLLDPRQAKIPWKSVIRSGFQIICSTPGRHSQTWVRRNRRSPAAGPQFPGWMGVNPSIAISVDVSGSMGGKMLESICAEIVSLLKQFPEAKAYLNAHTDQVVWGGWISHNTKAKLKDALAFSGGTDPKPAYEDIGNQRAKFDCLVHMTDTCFSEFPTVPAKKLVVGAYCRELYAKPPPGAHVIMCDVEDFT